MPFLLAEILNFQGSTHRIGVGSFSQNFIVRTAEIGLDMSGQVPQKNIVSWN